jgi:hypothetical protein
MLPEPIVARVDALPSPVSTGEGALFALAVTVAPRCHPNGCSSRLPSRTPTREAWSARVGGEISRRRFHRPDVSPTPCLWFSSGDSANPRSRFTRVYRSQGVVAGQQPTEGDQAAPTLGPAPHPSARKHHDGCLPVVRPARSGEQDRVAEVPIGIAVHGGNEDKNNTTGPRRRRSR